MSTPRILRIETLTACLALAGSVGGAETAFGDDPVAAARAQRIRQAIRAGLPAYEPRADGDVTMTESPEGAVERDGTLQLPKVTVEAKVQRRIREYEMLTPKGRMEMALKRYPGAKIGNLFGLNRGVALALLEEEVEAEKRHELKTLVENLTYADDSGGRALKRLMQDAVARPNTDWKKGRSGR